jgi:uncharacterized protein YbjT (DUF2867 family)
MQSSTAVVLGATGLVGQSLVQQLLEDSYFSKVRILVRQAVNFSHPKLEVEIVNFDNLVEFRKKLGKGDCIFCCVGTTQKQVKGDKKAYHKVDVDLPVNAAKMAKDAGFTTFLLVSAVGADAHSANFYLRFKGEAEQKIAEVNLKTFHAFRPGILLGKRKEFRMAESVGKGVMHTLSALFVGNLKKYRGIDAADVARAMVAAAKREGRGMFVHHYDDMMNANNDK